MTKSNQFDDRVDLETDLNLSETLGLLARSLKLLSDVKKLFTWKCFFAGVAIIPPLFLPWMLKIVVDQVVLQESLEEGLVEFPPFMIPFINLVQDFSPSGIMISVSTFYFLMLVFFGLRAVGQIAVLPPGYDPATQSEQALSAGQSQANGLWGLVEVLLTIRLTQRLANRLRTRLMGRLTRLNMTTLDEQRIGDSVYRIMYDAPMLPEICFKLTLAPILLLTSSALSIYIMQYSYGTVAPEIIWIAIGLIPITLMLTMPLSGIARRVNQTSRAAGASTTNAVESSIDNIAAIQSLGGMARETEQFRAKSAESFRRHRHTVLIDSAVTVIAYSSITLAVGTAFVFITDRIILSELSPGDYAALWGFFLALSYSARDIGLYWIQLQKNVSAVRRVFFFIDYTSERDESSQPLESLEQAISLHDVSYAYPDGRSALTNINVELPIGQLIAIVGPTGAGKTTLAYLLPGYLRPTKGAIYFDGQNLKDTRVEDIRERVTYVFQEHMLLSESIRDNLLLANPSASEEEMIAACQTAGAMEFIEELPDGIDTIIGKAGDTLSVGQKQRLSIARGIVRNTPVLILDEPTAALDPKTENALVEALQQTARNRLVIVIAHRLSTIREADRIIFLEQGEIKDSGTHIDLMKDVNGAYRKFVDLQST